MRTTNLKLIIVFALIAVLMVLVVGTIGFVFNIPFSDLTANPVSRLNAPFYQGILQRIGMILWGSIVILTLCNYYFLKSSGNLKELRKFLFFSGIFFGYLLMDELLLIHNFIFPKVLNIHQLLVLIVYVFLTIIFLLRFGRIIKNNFLWLFIIAITFLGISMMVDILSYLRVIQLGFRYLLDDGAKFLGTFSLFIYYFILLRSKVYITSNFDSAP